MKTAAIDEQPQHGRQRGEQPQRGRQRGELELLGVLALALVFSAHALGLVGFGDTAAVLEAVPPPGFDVTLSAFAAAAQAAAALPRHELDPMKDWVERAVAPGVDTPGKSKCHKIEAGPGGAGTSYPELLPKRSFGGTRFVFLAGLEGAGHHALGKFFSDCGAIYSGHCICPKHLWATNTTNAVNVTTTLSSARNLKGLFGASLEKPYLEPHRPLFEQFAAIRDHPRTQGKTVILNTMCRAFGEGEMSYPNFIGRCRSWRIPDVRLLADVCESLGIDFRVLVIVRRPMEILLSTVVHRHFHSWSSGAQMYARMLRRDIMEHQLLRMDPRFTRCMDYNKLPIVPSGLEAFLGIDPGTHALQQSIDDDWKPHDAAKQREEEMLALQKYGSTSHLVFEEANAELRALCDYALGGFG